MTGRSEAFSLPIDLICDWLLDKRRENLNKYFIRIKIIKVKSIK